MKRPDIRVRDLMWLMKGCSVELKTEHEFRCGASEPDLVCPNYDIDDPEEMTPCECCSFYEHRVLENMEWYGNVYDIPIMYAERKIIRIEATTFVEPTKCEHSRKKKNLRINKWNHATVIIGEGECE